MADRIHALREDVGRAGEHGVRAVLVHAAPIAPNRGTSSRLPTRLVPAPQCRWPRVVAGRLRDVEADRRQEIEPWNVTPSPIHGMTCRRVDEFRRRHQPHDVMRHGGESGLQQHEHGHAVRRHQPEGVLRVGLLHRRVVEGCPRVFEGAEKELDGEPEGGADRVDADVAQAGEQAEQIAIGDRHDLLGESPCGRRGSPNRSAWNSTSHREGRPDERGELAVGAPA